MEATTKRKLTQTDCDMAKYLLEHGQTLKEIALIIKCDPSTVGKIRLANYDLPTYLEQRKAMNRKTKENKAAAEAGRKRLNELLDRFDDPERDKRIREQIEALDKRELEIHERMRAGEPIMFIPGQTKMNLDDLGKDPSPAAQDDTKSMMKFQAAMMDKLLKKLDELIDVLKGGERNE